MEIRKLSEFPEYIDIVHLWLKNEWGNMDILKDIKDITAKSNNALPMVYIALKNKKIVGTVSILNDDMDIRKNLNPWIGCLFVEEKSRMNKIATELFCFCENEAKKMGIKKIYLFTSKIHNLAFKANWKEIETLFFEDEYVKIMFKEL